MKIFRVFAFSLYGFWFFFRIFLRFFDSSTAQVVVRSFGGSPPTFQIMLKSQPGSGLVSYHSYISNSKEGNCKAELVCYWNGGAIVFSYDF